MAVDIVRPERLFDPVGVVLFVTFQVLHRGWEVLPGVVCVQRQEHVRADCFPRRAHPGLLFGRRQAAHLHLYRLKTQIYVRRHLRSQLLRCFSGEVVPAGSVGGYGILGAATEIAVQGKFHAACIEVPQGRIENADGAHHRSRPSLKQGFLEHRLPQSFGAGRFLPEESWRQQLFDGVRHERPGGRPCVAEAYSFHAIGRAHFHQAIVAGAHASGRESRDMIERNARGAHGYRFDLCHRGFSANGVIAGRKG